MCVERSGTLFMGLIHTCRLCGANSFDYVVELQRHARDWRPTPRGVDVLEVSRDAGAACSKMNPSGRKDRRRSW